MPFELPEGGHIFVGPISFRSVDFNVEVKTAGEKQGSITILPPVIIVNGERVVRAELYRRFQVGRKFYNFNKGSKVFIFK